MSDNVGLRHLRRNRCDSLRLEGGVSVERDTLRLVPPHSTLKPFFSKTRFRRVRHWYSKGGYPVILVPPAFSREASGISLSLFFSLLSLSLSLSVSLYRQSEFGSTKSPPHTLLVRPITMTRPLVAPLHPRPVVRRGKYPLVLSPQH